MGFHGTTAVKMTDYILDHSSHIVMAETDLDFETKTVIAVEVNHRDVFVVGTVTA